MSTMPKNLKRSVSGPALITISINIEGFSNTKSDILQEICEKNTCDIICVQETHRDKHNSPKIRGMKLAIERPHKKYGSTIFVRDNLKILSTSHTETNNIEILTVELTNCTVHHYTNRLIPHLNLQSQIISKIK